MSTLNDIRTLNIPSLITKDTDIKTILNDINHNFNILRNQQLWVGPAGLSLEPVFINFNDLLIGTPNYTGTRLTPSFISNDFIKSLYRKILDKVKQVNSTSNFEDVGNYKWDWVFKYLEAVNNSNRNLYNQLWNIHNANFLPGGMVVMMEKRNGKYIPWFSSFYTYVDPRFRKQDQSEYKENQKDLSCSISIDRGNIPLDREDFNIGVFNSFPQLMYNKHTNGYTWKINGVETTIPASGQKGDPGSTGSILVVTRGKVPVSGDTYKVTHLSQQALYEDVNNTRKVNNYKQWGEKYNGLPCIVKPNGTSSADRLGVDIWISTISYDGNEIW